MKLGMKYNHACKFLLKHGNKISYYILLKKIIFYKLKTKKNKKTKTKKKTFH